MGKPVVRLRHEVLIGAGRLALYRAPMPLTFIKMMDAVYPTLVSKSEERRGQGYVAFDLPTSTFIGTFCGMTLASVRRNPWLVETGDQLFLKALLAGLHLDQHEVHNSRCAATNYGTLRLWQKLGLGAKWRGEDKGRVRDLLSAEGTPENCAFLQQRVDLAKPDYAEVRAYAEKRLAKINPAEVLPTMTDMGDSEMISANVVLGKVE